MKRPLIIIIIILLLAGALIGYRIYNKPSAKPEDVTGTEVYSTTLSEAYHSDEATANAKYLGKALSLKGWISEIETTADGKMVLIFKNGEEKPVIRATLRDATQNIANNSDVTLKGFCDAYLPGDDIAGISLPGTIVVSDCIISK